MDDPHSRAHTLSVPTRRVALACVMLVATPRALFAQGADAKVARAADAYITSLVHTHDFSGSVLVTRNHHVLFQRSYGFANREQRRPILTATRFAIGSITKSFTAAAVIRLSQRGLLSLTDPVARYLPEIGHGDSITIEQLLTHTAGVPDYYLFPEYRAAHCEPIGVAAFLALIRQKPLDFAPGRGSGYSNSGYFVLAALVERVSGAHFDAFLHSELFAPLGMSATGSLSSGGTADLASGYDPGFPPDWFQPAPCVDRSWLFGSASLYSTTGDLSKWAEAIARDSSLTRSGSSVHFGWGERDRFGRRMVEQNGRVPLGFVSYLGVWPADSLVVIALGNVQVDVAERIGIALAAIALGQPHEAARAPRATAMLDSVTLATYVGAYQITPSLILRIAAQRRGLELAGPDGIFIPLDAESKDRFFFRALYTPITFVRDSTGDISALQWGASFAARRTPAVPDGSPR